MTDHDTSNEQYVIYCQEEVDQFLAKFDWKSAQKVIDDMRARGFSHEADILRKVLLEAQFVYTEGIRYEPVTDEIPTIAREEGPVPADISYGDQDESLARESLHDERKARVSNEG